jgi:hypothetical protein
VAGERTIAAGTMVVGTLNMGDSEAVKEAAARVRALQVSSIGLAALSIAIGPPLLGSLPSESVPRVATGLVLSTLILAGWSGYIAILKRRIEGHLAALAAADGVNAVALLVEQWVSHTRRVSVRQLLKSVWLATLLGGGTTAIVLGSWMALRRPRSAQEIRPDYLDDEHDAGATWTNELIALNTGGDASFRLDASSLRRDAGEPAHTWPKPSSPSVPPGPEGGAKDVAPPPRSAPVTVEDRERQLALQGTPDAKLELKKQLEQRIYDGRGTDQEIKLLISTCKDLGDQPCVKQARTLQQQRQQ